MASTRRTVLALYTRLFRIARNWQAQTGVAADTESERKYMVQEARTLFRRNQQLTDPETIKKCIEECEARIEIESIVLAKRLGLLLLRSVKMMTVLLELMHRKAGFILTGLHYKNPYPRAIYLPPLGLATQKGRRLRTQQRLRKQAKPIYLQSQDET